LLLKLLGNILAFAFTNYLHLLHDFVKARVSCRFACLKDGLVVLVLIKDGNKLLEVYFAVLQSVGLIIQDLFNSAFTLYEELDELI